MVCLRSETACSLSKLGPAGGHDYGPNLVLPRFHAAGAPDSTSAVAPTSAILRLALHHASNVDRYDKLIVSYP